MEEVFTNKKRILATNAVVDLNTGGFYPLQLFDLMYFYRFFSMLDFREYYKGTALPTLDMDKLKNLPIPLPPLAEQRFIAEELEKLLALCKKLKKA